MHNWVRFGYAFTAAHSGLWQLVPAETCRKPAVLPLIITLSRRQQGFESPTACQPLLLIVAPYLNIGIWRKLFIRRNMVAHPSKTSQKAVGVPRSDVALVLIFEQA